MQKNPDNTASIGVPLSDEELEQISGGAMKAPVRGNPILRKQAELERTWNEMGFFEHDFTRHQMDAYLDLWQDSGFSGTAEEFLSRFKDW